MALKQNDVAKGSGGVPYPDCAGDVASCRFWYQLSGTEAAGDIIEIGVLPAYCTVFDAILDSDDLDSNAAPALALNAGLMSGVAGKKDATRTCGAELFSGSTVGQAGGVERASAKTAFRIAPIETERGIGVKIATAAATGAAGTIGLTLFYGTK